MSGHFARLCAYRYQKRYLVHRSGAISDSWLGDGMGCQQVFNPNGQAADRYAGGVVDRRSDGWGDAGQADFANTTSAILSHDGIGNVEEVNIDIRRVSDCG